MRKLYNKLEENKKQLIFSLEKPLDLGVINEKENLLIMKWTNSYSKSYTFI